MIKYRKPVCHRNMPLMYSYAFLRVCRHAPLGSRHATDTSRRRLRRFHIAHKLSLTAPIDPSYSGSLAKLCSMFVRKVVFTNKSER